MVIALFAWSVRCSSVDNQELSLRMWEYIMARCRERETSSSCFLFAPPPFPHFRAVAVGGNGQGRHGMRLQEPFTAHTDGQLDTSRPISPFGHAAFHHPAEIVKSELSHLFIIGHFCSRSGRAAMHCAIEIAQRERKLCALE